MALIEDFSFESSYFLSAPPSPCTTVPPTPNAKQNLALQFSDDLDFHFTSTFHSPNKTRGLHRRAESTPPVSFADELFSDGKVKPLPPPPAGSRSPAAGSASPRSPLSRRNNLWNEDLDPFVAALETFKDDNHRRQVKILSGDYDQGIRKTKRRKMMMRFLSMRSKSLQKEERENNNNHGRSMKTLIKRLSFNRSEAEEKKKKKTTVAMAGSATRNGSRAVTKVAIMQYRPKLLLCLGYGLRKRSST